MRRNSFACLLAGLWIAATAPAFAQQPGNKTAQQNVRQSEQYERLLCTNSAFRAKRIAEECGPLQGSQLYGSCVASFRCNKAQAPHWRRAPPSERITR